MIERLLNGKPCVLATGGGAFMDNETRALIRGKGQSSVWLHADVDVLVERTGQAGYQAAPENRRSRTAILTSAF